MKLDLFAVSIIVFYVIVVAGVMMVVDVNSNYDDVDISITDYISDTSNLAQANDTHELADSMHGQVLGSEVGSDTLEDAMFKGGFSATRLVTSPISMTNKIMNQIGTQLGIPGIFLKFAFTALTIMVIFAVIFLIFRIKA